MGADSAYLLAAGHGRRAGGPKAWLEHDGETLLERQVRFLRERFDPGNIVVTIQKEWTQRCRDIHAEVRWTAEDPEASPLHALQTLFTAVPFAGWAFFYHVDMPVWSRELFDLLEDRIPAAEAAGRDAVVPVREDRGGHPVLLSARLRAPLAALDPGRDRLDHWLRARKVERVEVSFAVIHENWNEGGVASR